jgi:hypothetical protein
MLSLRDVAASTHAMQGHPADVVTCVKCIAILFVNVSCMLVVCVVCAGLVAPPICWLQVLVVTTVACSNRV